MKAPYRGTKRPKSGMKPSRFGRLPGHSPRSQFLPEARFRYSITPSRTFGWIDIEIEPREEGTALRCESGPSRRRCQSELPPMVFTPAPRWSQYVERSAIIFLMLPRFQRHLNFRQQLPLPSAPLPSASSHTPPGSCNPKQNVFLSDCRTLLCI